MRRVGGGSRLVTVIRGRHGSPPEREGGAALLTGGEAARVVLAGRREPGPVVRPDPTAALDRVPGRVPQTLSDRVGVGR